MPIIVLLGFPRVEDRDHMLRAGATVVLSKPLGPEDLYWRWRRARRSDRVQTIASCPGRGGQNSCRKRFLAICTLAAVAPNIDQTTEVLMGSSGSKVSPDLQAFLADIL